MDGDAPGDSGPCSLWSSTAFISYNQAQENHERAGDARADRVEIEQVFAHRKAAAQVV